VQPSDADFCYCTTLFSADCVSRWRYINEQTTPTDVVISRITKVVDRVRRHLFAVVLIARRVSAQKSINLPRRRSTDHVEIRRRPAGDDRAIVVEGAEKLLRRGGLGREGGKTVPEGGWRPDVWMCWSYVVNFSVLCRRRLAAAAVAAFFSFPTTPLSRRCGRVYAGRSRKPSTTVVHTKHVLVEP